MSNLAGVIRELASEHLKDVQVDGDFIHAACPFHQTKSGTPFWMSLKKGSYGCWSCSARGDSLEELLRALKISVTGSVRGIIQLAREEARRQAPIERAKKKKLARKKLVGTSLLPAKELLPIYDFDPVELINEGFSPEILAEHHIGFDRDRGKITFPVFDLEGNLIGISGRRSDIRPGPKYKFYDGWHNNGDGVRVPGELGEWYPHYTSEGIRDHLWRGNIVFPRAFSGEWKQIVVVEGFKAALWMVQHGYENTVAIMGSKMSAQQERAVRRMGAEVFVFLDANDAGRDGSEDLCYRLGAATFPVYEVGYDLVEVECSEDQDEDEVRDGLQPSDLSKEAIDLVLSNATQILRMRRPKNPNQKYAKKEGRS